MSRKENTKLLLLLLFTVTHSSTYTTTWMLVAVQLKFTSYLIRSTVEYQLRHLAIEWFYSWINITALVARSVRALKCSLLTLFSCFFFHITSQAILIFILLLLYPNLFGLRARWRRWTLVNVHAVCTQASTKEETLIAS